MKQIEITVRLEEEKNSAYKKLEKAGFKIIRESDIDDIYMTSKLDILNKDNIQDILKKSVLLRKFSIDGNEIKKITYKNKELDELGMVLSEEKITIPCDDLADAKKLFEKLDFKELVNVRYHITVYAKDGLEFAFQDVENLGTLIEFENDKDFNNKSKNEIYKEKEKMHSLIKNYGLKISEDFDIKKAKELISKRWE